MTSVNLAARHATALLAALDVAAVVAGEADHPALAWRRAGLMAVTGEPDGPALICPAALTAAADGALLALQAIAPGAALPLNGALLLGERARLLGLSRGGRVSANASCRLLTCVDGGIALNLARPDDWDLMPLLFERAAGDWTAVARAAAGRPVDELIARGVALGLPIARDARTSTPDVFALSSVAPSNRARASGRPLVLDFSALWAGPLAASLLAMVGADVVKVESRGRPDGARYGHAGFYDLLNGGKRSIAVDFSDPHALARLIALVERADIVIEGSRPRALRGLGIDRDAAVARGCVWVSITAHDDSDRIGFGDDAAIEGGLGRVMREGWGEAMFAGDAIADPLTGLHAALAAWALWRRGRGGLVQLALSRTVAAAIALGVASGDELQAWQRLAEADRAPPYPLRTATTVARRSGADNDAFV